MNDYKPIKQQKTSDLIVREIWDMILQGKLKPGDKLPPERELVKKFEVSMVTLREALKTLEIYGHISKKRGVQGGSVILDIAPTSGINLLVDFLKSKKYTLNDLIEAKSIIDPLIAEMASSQLTKKDKKALSALVEKHEKDYRERGTSRAGWEFYTLLGKITKNPILIVISELITSLIMEKEFSMGIGDLESPSEVELEYNRSALESHKRVVEAFLSENKSQIKMEMLRNNENFSSEIRKIQELRKPSV
ncbi:GntR family transcriptional regulator [bacterium]|nr:GntR family transcriptional regulator [bacterium]